MEQQERNPEQVHESKIIGVRTPRIDGPLKTTGRAMQLVGSQLPGSGLRLANHGYCSQRYRSED